MKHQLPKGDVHIQTIAIQCPVKKCTNTYDAPADMCKPHWRRVPGSIKRAITNATNIHERTEHLSAAIEAVAGVRNIG